MAEVQPPGDHAAPSAEGATPRTDFFGALGWIALGVAVLIGSLTMDRLERQHINPYTAPGLLPGLLGLAMIVLGAALAFRSWRRGALRIAAPAITTDQRDERKRIVVALALCLGYGVVLIGHGLPFWLASTIYVTASILVFRRLSRDAAERRFTAKAMAQAVVIALAGSLITQWLFQDLFLVRLP
ncbi:MAG: tripartite tricarboxylate transporter TctB family protein [Burkholderiaceae bacterium]